MPTYDYECTICEHKFEMFQSIKARRITKCPECGKRVRRLIGSGAAVIFKGSGFYQTDYRSPDYQKAAKADKEAGTAKPDKAAATANPATKSSDKKSNGGKSETSASA